MADQSGILSRTKDAVTDPDKRLGEEVPGMPFGLVALSYLGVLMLACAIIAFIIWAGS